MSKVSKFKSNDLALATKVNISAIRALDELTVGQVGRVELDLGTHEFIIVTRKKRVKRVAKVVKKVTKNKAVKKVNKRKVVKNQRRRKFQRKGL